MTFSPKVLRTSYAKSILRPMMRYPRAHWTWRLGALFVASLICVPALHAQFRGGIQGVVTDPSGAVVPDAKLTLTNTATNEKQTTTSNGGGVYNFSGLPPGTFAMTVERTGFTM